MQIYALVSEHLQDNLKEKHCCYKVFFSFTHRNLYTEQRWLATISGWPATKTVALTSNIYVTITLFNHTLSLLTLWQGH